MLSTAWGASLDFR